MSAPPEDKAASTMAIDETPKAASPYDTSSTRTNEAQNGNTEKKEDEDASETRYDYFRDWRFWMIMLTLWFAILLASLESTVVITSLPTIVADLNIGSNYIWVTNVFFLARYVPNNNEQSGKVTTVF